MGQRLIITEEDKKNILSLYEVKNTPPYEKVLFAKEKNPFKYDEYKDARRKYNAGLVDGELFYEAPNFSFPNFLRYSDDRYSPDNSFSYQELFTPIIVNKLLNKTIRDNTDDKIYKIQGIHFSTSNSEPYLKLTLLNNKLLLIEPNSVSFTNPNKPFDTPTQLNENQLKDYSNLIQISRQLMDTLVQQINFYKDPKNISEVPDKYFNIYKVVRQTTDF